MDVGASMRRCTTGVDANVIAAINGDMPSAYAQTSCPNGSERSHAVTDVLVSGASAGLHASLLRARAGRSWTSASMAGRGAPRRPRRRRPRRHVVVKASSSHEMRRQAAPPPHDVLTCSRGSSAPDVSS